MPFINEACRELMDHAERWMREEIRHIPDGEYAFEDVMEDDGATENPTWFRVTMVVRGDEIIADWSRSDPQARGIVNATFGVTASATYNAIFHVTDKNIPHNSGCYRPIKIIAPPGSCVNVRYPGPSVAGNTESHPRMVDLILGALAQAVPDRVAAAEGGTSCNFLFGGVHPETGQYYANYHFEGGGWGGRAFADGNNALIVPNGNCRNTPVEVFETRYPFLTHSYKLVADSAGPGTYRGGLGTQRIIEVLPPAEITVSAVFERMRVSPWGLFEGGHANNSAILVKKRGDPTFRTFKEVYHTVSPAKFVNCVVSPGDQILLQAPGGGGYGHPYKRPVEPKGGTDGGRLGEAQCELVGNQRHQLLAVRADDSARYLGGRRGRPKTAVLRSGSGARRASCLRPRGPRSSWAIGTNRGGRRRSPESQRTGAPPPLLAPTSRAPATSPRSWRRPAGGSVRWTSSITMPASGRRRTARPPGSPRKCGSRSLPSTSRGRTWDVSTAFQQWWKAAPSST